MFVGGRRGRPLHRPAGGCLLRRVCGRNTTVQPLRAAPATEISRWEGLNIPFVTGDKELDAAVVAASKEAGFDNLKGHKSVGGLRASVYNAMPIEGAQALVDFLTKFEAEHK